MGYWADKYMGIHTAKRRSLKLVKIAQIQGKEKGAENR